MFSRRRLPLSGAQFEAALGCLSPTSLEVFQRLSHFALKFSPNKWVDRLTAAQKRHFRHISRPSAWNQTHHDLRAALSRVPVLSLAVHYTGEDMQFLTVAVYNGVTACFVLPTLAQDRSWFKKGELLPQELLKWLADEHTFVLTTANLSLLRSQDIAVKKEVDPRVLFSIYQEKGVICPALQTTVGDLTWQLAYAVEYHHRPSTRPLFEQLVAPARYEQDKWPDTRMPGWVPVPTHAPSDFQQFFLLYEAYGAFLFVYRLLRHGIIYGDMNAVQSGLGLSDVLQHFLRIGLDKGERKLGDPLGMFEEVAKEPCVPAGPPRVRPEEGGEVQVMEVSEGGEGDEGVKVFEVEEGEEEDNDALVIADEGLEEELGGEQGEERKEKGPTFPPTREAACPDRKRTWSGRAVTLLPRNNNKHQDLRQRLLAMSGTAEKKTDSHPGYFTADYKKRQENTAPPSARRVSPPRRAPRPPTTPPPSPRSQRRVVELEEGEVVELEEGEIKDGDGEQKGEKEKEKDGGGEKKEEGQEGMGHGRGGEEGEEKKPDEKAVFQRLGPLPPRPAAEDVRLRGRLRHRAVALGAEAADPERAAIAVFKPDINQQLMRRVEKKANADNFVEETRLTLHYAEEVRTPPADSPINRNLLDQPQLSDEETFMNAFVDLPVFPRRCDFCSGSHCSRFLRGTRTPNCKKWRSHTDHTPTRSLCSYRRCQDPSQHHTPVCPFLHARCPRCRCRGHDESDRCDVRNAAVMEGLRADFEEVANMGFFTKERFRQLQWGWYPYPVTAPVDTMIVDYRRLTDMAVRDALALLHSLLLLPENQSGPPYFPHQVSRIGADNGEVQGPSGANPMGGAGPDGPF